MNIDGAPGGSAWHIVSVPAGVHGRYLVGATELLANGCADEFRYGLAFAVSCLADGFSRLSGRFNLD